MGRLLGSPQLIGPFLLRILARHLLRLHLLNACSIYRKVLSGKASVNSLTGSCLCQ